MVPVTVLPTANTSVYASHGLDSTCLWPKLKRRLSASISRTTTSNLAPMVVNSEGCLIFFVQLKSEMWIKPSIPSSSSKNIPKFVKLRTVPSCFEPCGYLVVISVHGSVVNCLIPKLILRSSRSNVTTSVSTSSPTFMKSPALRKCADQLISLT